MNIKKEIKENYEIAKSKGFYPEDSKIEDHLMGIVSELGEAYEAHRNDLFYDKEFAAGFIEDFIDGKVKDKKGIMLYKSLLSGTFEDELADVFIRLFNLMGHYKLSPEDKWYIYGTENYVGETLTDVNDVAGALLYLSARVSKLKNDEGEPYIADLAKILTNLQFLCTNLNIPIEKHIQAKKYYNKSREHLHGKKY